MRSKTDIVVVVEVVVAVVVIVTKVSKCTEYPLHFLIVT